MFNLQGLLKAVLKRWAQGFRDLDGALHPNLENSSLMAWHRDHWAPQYHTSILHRCMMAYVYMYMYAHRTLYLSVCK